MDREHVKGAADKIKGAVKDMAGKMTGDKEMQAEGKMDKAKGAAHNAAGDAKDIARDATRQRRLGHRAALSRAALSFGGSGCVIRVALARARVRFEQPNTNLCPPWLGFTSELPTGRDGLRGLRFECNT